MRGRRPALVGRTAELRAGAVTSCEEQTRCVVVEKDRRTPPRGAGRLAATTLRRDGRQPRPRQHHPGRGAAHRSSRPSATAREACSPGRSRWLATSRLASAGATRTSPSLGAARLRPSRPGGSASERRARYVLEDVHAADAASIALTRSSGRTHRGLGDLLVPGPGTSPSRREVNAVLDRLRAQEVPDESSPSARYQPAPAWRQITHARGAKVQAGAGADGRDRRRQPLLGVRDGPGPGGGEREEYGDAAEPHARERGPGSTTTRTSAN